MRASVRGIPAALVVLAALSGVAEARCANELKALQARVDRAQKQKPTPQSAAAAKILHRLSQSATADEVACYNAVARAQRALAEKPPVPLEPKNQLAHEPKPVAPQPVRRVQPENVTPVEEPPNRGAR
jgi:hypothetical protein